MKDCVLVTGGAGFIGCATADALQQLGLPIVAMDNLHPQVHKLGQRPEALPGHVTLVKGDISDANAWTGLLEQWRPQVVLHLAAETGTGQSLTEASRHAMVNVVGTTRMTDALAAAGILPRRFVLTSSRAVYGEGAWRRADGSRYYPGQRSAAMLDAGIWDFTGASVEPFCADITETHPTSVYGATKLAQEHLLRAWALSFGSELAIVRLQNVYGPGQSLDNPYTGIVSLFSRMAKAGQSIPLYEDGLMLRDFVFIDDVAAAVVAATLAPEAPGRIFDIGTGEGTTIRDVAEAVAAYYGAPAPHVCGKYRNGDVRHASCEVEAAKAIEWAPRVPVKAGIERLCRWIDGKLDT